MKKNNKWIIVSLIGGFLMIISNTVGNIVLYYILFERSQQYLDNEQINLILIWLLIIIVIVANSGGVAVIIGTLFISVRYYEYGKLLSSLGTGIGLIGLTLLFFYSLLFGSILFENNITIITITSITELIGASGLILVIYSRKKISKSEISKLNSC